MSYYKPHHTHLLASLDLPCQAHCLVCDGINRFFILRPRTRVIDTATTLNPRSTLDPRPTDTTATTPKHTATSLLPRQCRWWAAVAAQAKPQPSCAPRAGQGLCQRGECVYVYVCGWGGGWVGGGASWGGMFDPEQQWNPSPLPRSQSTTSGSGWTAGVGAGGLGGAPVPGMWATHQPSLPYLSPAQMGQAPRCPGPRGWRPTAP